MHTFKGAHSVFNFNGDLSGDVIISPHPDGGDEFVLPASDILAFVAHYVALDRISTIEQSDYTEILGIKRPRVRESLK